MYESGWDFQIAPAEEAPQTPAHYQRALLVRVTAVIWHAGAAIRPRYLAIRHNSQG
jgi:hypothetical protein